ncbi:hypothetical protein LJB85_00910 [Porphyromonadaceae bacterium OttesenSCG-928-L07]|nr:hypothetical protein [Porphyromonadaceae bacterium OttesenSCG-928-L07]MDL2252352.1 hypothetical protein [Odoribacter sp. OttesenSCG-928-J03]
MEKRLGIIAIIITGKKHVSEINDLISAFAGMIVARQGIPMPEKNLSFISLVVEASMDRINTLTGKLGRMPDVEVKSIITKTGQAVNDNNLKTDEQ